MKGRIICSWHFINWNCEFDMGEARSEGDTHSICPSCMKVMQDCSNIKIDSLKAARTSDRFVAEVQMGDTK